MSLALTGRHSSIKRAEDWREELKINLYNHVEVKSVVGNHGFISLDVDGPHSNTYQPRHPKYRDKSERLFSYTFWRHGQIQDPTRLADYGFFYTGEGDLVRCFYCSIGLKDFISADDPLLEHIRHSGDCPFLLEFLGPRSLSEYQKRIQSETNARSPQFSDFKSAETKSSSSVSPGGNVVATSTCRPTQRYRHPEYQSVNARIASFTQWPRDHVQTPRQVAEAGFYHTGTGDIVRCFACDGGLQLWDPRDDPWIEHCRHFPFCPFVRDVKGDAYIAQVKHFYEIQQKQEMANVGLPVQKQNSNSKQVEEIVTPMTKLSIEERSRTNYENPNNATKTSGDRTRKPRWRSFVAETVLGMGFRESEVEVAVEQIRTEEKEETVDLVIETIEIQSKNINAGQLDSHDAEDVIAEHLRLKSMLICNRCNQRDTNALFLPCQHHRFCVDCSKLMTNCPICGKKIDHVVKTFSS